MFIIKLKKKKYKEPEFKAASFDLEALRFSFEKIMKKGIKRIIHEDCGNKRVKCKVFLQMIDLHCQKCRVYKSISFSQEEKLAIVRMVMRHKKDKIKLKDIIVDY